jgi:hypothetical protein
MINTYLRLGSCQKIGKLQMQPFSISKEIILVVGIEIIPVFAGF